MRAEARRCAIESGAGPPLSSRPASHATSGLIVVVLALLLAARAAAQPIGGTLSGQWQRVEERARATAGEDSSITILCECSSLDCTERIVLTPAEYETAHAEPSQFTVVPGHASDGVEDVVFDVAVKIRVAGHGADGRNQPIELDDQPGEGQLRLCRRGLKERGQLVTNRLERRPQRPPQDRCHEKRHVAVGERGKLSARVHQLEQQRRPRPRQTGDEHRRLDVDAVGLAAAEGRLEFAQRLLDDRVGERALLPGRQGPQHRRLRVGGQRPAGRGETRPASAARALGLRVRPATADGGPRPRRRPARRSDRSRGSRTGTRVAGTR